MSILQRLKEELLQNRKTKNKTNVIILSTMIGEIQTLQSRDRTRELQDIDVIKLIDKSIQGLQERNAIRPSDELLHEINLLNSFLPKKLSENEIRRIKTENSFASAKELMPFLSKHYPGLYDGKLASKIASE